MEVVAGAAVVVSRVMVGAVLAVVVTTSRHMPYKLHAPAGCATYQAGSISLTAVKVCVHWQASTTRHHLTERASSAAEHAPIAANNGMSCLPT